MTTIQASYDATRPSSPAQPDAVGPADRHLQGGLVRVIDELDVVSILDVGCGSGYSLAALARSANSYELTGADVSEQALRATGRRVPAADLHMLDVQRETIPWRFDLVMAVHVIEHLYDDLGAMRNMAAMSNKYVLLSSLAGRVRPTHNAAGHLRNYTALELRQRLEAIDLNVVWMRGWGWPFYSPVARTMKEWLPGVPEALGSLNRTQRAAAQVAHQLYRLNVPGRGDVITVLASH